MLKIQLSLDHLKEWINKFQTTRHTHNNKIFKLSTWIWRHQSILFNIFYVLFLHLIVFVICMFQNF